MHRVSLATPTIHTVFKEPENSSPRRPALAVSTGDPLGIGPEVTVKALSDPALRAKARFFLLGGGESLHAAAERAGIEPFWWRVRRGSEAIETSAAHDAVLIDSDDGSGEREPTRGLAGRAGPTRSGGEASFRFVEDAIAMTRLPVGRVAHCDGIVTAPISKEAWALAGREKYPGHTELLASRFNAKRTRMMFVAPELRVMLVTAHLPLMRIRDVLTIGRVFDTIALAHESCVGLGVTAPRVAVCGLNPHAGEGGLLGDEEERLIAPAVRLAKEQGVQASGPYPGDTVFNAARSGKFDIVVAMYHDQGLIPVKLLAFDRAVNMTAGLPVVRTSPDHGTAFDIAGKNLADAGSMRAAIELAVALCSRAQAATSGAPS